MNCIYCFINNNSEIIYVGKTSDMKERMNQHFENGHLPKKAYREVSFIAYTEVKDEILQDVIEKYLIASKQPKYNTQYKTYTVRDSLNFRNLDWKFIDQDGKDIYNKDFVVRSIALKLKHKGLF